MTTLYVGGPKEEHTGRAFEVSYFFHARYLRAHAYIKQSRRGQAIQLAVKRKGGGGGGCRKFPSIIAPTLWLIFPILLVVFAVKTSLQLFPLVSAAELRKHTALVVRIMLGGMSRIVSDSNTFYGNRSGGVSFLQGACLMRPLP